VNVLGSLNLLEQSRKHGVRKFLYASTGGAAYGEPQQLPVPESHPVNPLDPYGASKHHVEHYLFLYRANYGLAYTVLRYPNVFGPRQDPLGEAGVVAIFTNKMLRGEPTINIGSGRGTNVNEIFDHLSELTHYPLPAAHGPSKLGEVYKIYLDPSRAKQLLGWETQVKLDEGLRQTVEFFRGT
jgi:UDP-glucose 4-epimerase